MKNLLIISIILLSLVIFTGCSKSQESKLPDPITWNNLVVATTNEIIDSFIEYSSWLFIDQKIKLKKISIQDNEESKKQISSRMVRTDTNWKKLSITVKEYYILESNNLLESQKHTESTITYDRVIEDTKTTLREQMVNQWRLEMNNTWDSWIRITFEKNDARCSFEYPTSDLIDYAKVENSWLLILWMLYCTSIQEIEKSQKLNDIYGRFLNDNSKSFIVDIHKSASFETITTFSDNRPKKFNWETVLLYSDENWLNKIGTSGPHDPADCKKFEQYSSKPGFELIQEYCINFTQ